MSVVLVTSRSFGSGALALERELLAAGHEVVRRSSTHDLAELADVLPRVDGWIAGTGPVTPAHLDLAPRLRVISRYGVGVDNVDLADAERRGITVTNTPGANSGAVADHTVALLLAALRGIPAADRRVRAGDWSGWSTRELGALTVGIVGLGRIGRGVIARLSGFHPRLLGFDPWVPHDDPVWAQAERVDLETIATEADVVSLHAPGGRVVIDEAWLAASDRPVILVNTARADLVDESSLAQAIRRGRVSSYAADTLSTESSADDRADHVSPLLAPDISDRVIVTAHLAAQTREGVDGMGRMATDDLLAVLDGRPAAHVVASATA
ncbi:NAD(P)-dependent oxidoreductase [Microbacterium sp. XT11]|uniref:NAD(P)-dependent oxidoreductase n=1 Tax=Microbacterium sp. XT11 TaxID=367477 RepID=UPI00074306FE|nr:NAD(P)-dependent oxidoreductase [Microbacterium sp. XT11]ALX65761.1 phosphoglycerate dehydrogenase [Microbacterium sp. XT11]